MSDVHDMSDGELNMAIAEEVMGLRVAGWWPCFMDTVNMMPEPRQFDIDDPFDWNGSREIRTEPDPWNARVSWMEPLLYVPRGSRGYLMHVPAYTTDARETERVMERMAGDDRYYFILRREDVDSYWATFRISGRFYGWSECSDWKRAVCEAALLAVRGAP